MPNPASQPASQIGIAPERRAHLAPIASQRPTRQLFAGIPFALTEVQHSAGAKCSFGAADEQLGQPTLIGTDGAQRSIRAPSRSSIETNVGSPPIVNRTSCDCSPDRPGAEALNPRPLIVE